MVKRVLILAVILSFFCIDNTQATNASYKYDNLSRLVEVLYENIGKIEYTYDAAGNRLSQKVTKLDSSTISVSPTNRNVTKEAGTTTFSVSNTGTGTISWTAAVTAGGSWLSITSGASGSNSGTITCSYSANTTTSNRIATVRTTASVATVSPVDVTVTQVPTTTPIGEYFKEDFSGSSTNTWTSAYGNWYVDNGKLNVDQIPSGKMAHYQTSFHPGGFFVIDTDVDVISIADGGAYGIYPFISGTERFEVNGKTLQGVGTIVFSDGDAYLVGWDSLGGEWYTSAKFVTAPPVTSIGVAFSSDKISLRINKENTIFFSGSFGAALSEIDSLWLMAQGDSTHVLFDNVYADPIPTPTPTTGSLAASFAGSGIWIYNSGTAAWLQVSSTNPENMIYSGSTLYMDFGAPYGLYRWDGTAWAQLTTANPENMVASGSSLYADFGASGLYKFDGAAWTQLTPANPENMVTAGSSLYADFGASGLYKFDGAAWTQLTSTNPDKMVTSGVTLYVGFRSLGLYKWDGTSWSQLTSSNPENMVTSGATLYVNFGATYGLQKWNGTAWTQLTSANPENMVASDSSLYADFGASGLYKFDGAAWAQLTSANPENMVTSSDSTLYVDFGALGIHKWKNSSWSQLTGSDPVIMVISN